MLRAKCLMINKRYGVTAFSVRRIYMCLICPSNQDYRGKPNIPMIRVITTKMETAYQTVLCSLGTGYAALLLVHSSELPCANGAVVDLK
jgi:hypothetical protein